jgi:hypothetical protein
MREEQLDRGGTNVLLEVHAGQLPAAASVVDRPLSSQSPDAVPAQMPN